MKHLFKTLFTAALVGILFSGHAQNRLASVSQTKSIKTKILFVVTSHSKLGNTGEKTGFWIEEFATPFYALTDKGYDVTVASPEGGQPPIDPKSSSPEYSTPSTKRFYSDAAAQEKLRHSVSLKEVNHKDFAAVFYPGGHGPMWDLAVDKHSIRLIESFYRSSKPVAFVCHGPAALKNVKDEDGAPLIKGKKVTGFSNTEETAVKLEQIVPFLLEDMMKDNGAAYSKGADWTPYAVQDGLLITGQNPASSELVAEKLLALLMKRS
jgi:putative intracellular protease/amidase